MLIDDLAAEFANIAEVEAVALGGSRASGWEDDASDIDIYVYSKASVPLERRSALARRRGDPIEIDNRYWETGDEWDEQETGVHVDVMYRALGATYTDLSRVLQQHEASIGYTTCIVHNLSTCRVLFDRGGSSGRYKPSPASPIRRHLRRRLSPRTCPYCETRLVLSEGRSSKQPNVQIKLQ
jgi:hypothetical protein